MATTDKRLTEKQKKFCEYYVNGNTGEEAHIKAYGGNNRRNSRSCASRMLKTDYIKAEIARIQAINAKIAEQATNKAAKKVAVEIEADIADKVERMAHLTKIMRGNVKVRVDKLFYDSKIGSVVVEPVDMLPGVDDQIKAIAELNKMFGDYAPIKQDLTTNGKDLAPQVILPGVNIEK